MAHSKETKGKISKGVRTAKNAKKVRQRRQAEADTILRNFQKGAQGRAASKVRRYAEQKEYSQVGDGELEEKEVTTLVEVPSSKLHQVEEPLRPSSPKPERR